MRIGIKGQAHSVCELGSGQCPAPAAHRSASSEFAEEHRNGKRAHLMVMVVFLERHQAGAVDEVLCMTAAVESHIALDDLSKSETKSFSRPESTKTLMTPSGCVWGTVRTEVAENLIKRRRSDEFSSGAW